MSEPSRRRPRRATRPATGGVDQTGGEPDPTLDDLDVEGTSAQADREDAHLRWLQEQRPPHWE